MKAALINEHLFDGLSLQDVLIHLRELLTPFFALEGVQRCLPDQVRALSEHPKVSILHLCMLELIFRNEHVLGSRHEFENILDVSLALLKAVHVIERRPLFIMMKLGSLGHEA